MSRKLSLSMSLVVSVALSGAGCEKGGAFDPLDNVPTGGNPTTNPTVTTDLPACDATSPKLPCKIDITDLSFDAVAGCNVTPGPTGQGKGWSNPATDKLQFGVDENSTVTSCVEAMVRECSVRLNKIPAAWNALPTGTRVRLSFGQKYVLDDALLYFGAKLDGSRLIYGVAQAGGRDLLTFTGSRKEGANPELHTAGQWLTMGVDRSLGFTLRTKCTNQVSAAAYWYIEKMTADALQ